MDKEIKLSVSPEEVRFIAILRAIKSFDKPHLISKEDTGTAHTLLTTIVPDLSDLEKQFSGSELKLFLRGYVTGLGASKVQEIPYDLDTYEETEFTGGRSGGVAIGQGEDDRFVSQTGPKE